MEPNTNILGILSVAELGVGTAISYSMYKPIAEKNTEKVIALYHLFINFYKKIAFIIFVSGLILLPFLPYLVNNYSLDVNIYISFFLMLVSIVLSYSFAAKSSKKLSC